MNLTANLEAVRARISDAGGSPDDVTIVAVTKGFGADAVEAAVDAGLLDVGESYAQELEAKATALPPATWLRCRFHFLGHVQRNKVRRISRHVHLWHAVDRASAGREIADHARHAKVLVQVNVSGEDAKHGCRFAEAPELVDTLGGMGLDVRGLMAVGPTGPPELARPGFRRLVELADRLGLPERSMGMTDDLEVAVQEGTTMVRVGRALFGARSEPSDLRR
jgi:pyridoxal phosphate enzyme (YggS family)